MSDERRHFQRLNLTKPVDGRFGGTPVTVIEVSGGGALLVTDVPLQVGARGALRFTWRDEEIDVMAEVVRSDPSRAGLQFTTESEPLRRILGESVVELLRAQEANASGDRERNVVGDDQTLTAAAGFRLMDAYMTYRFTASGWKCRRALLPDQPPDGFTIAANVPEGEVDLLRRTYESGDGEARRMTRLLAELSVAARRSHP